jgi:hypothetical protein
VLLLSARSSRRSHSSRACRSETALAGEGAAGAPSWPRQDARTVSAADRRPRRGRPRVLPRAPRGRRDQRRRALPRPASLASAGSAGTFPGRLSAGAACRSRRRARPRGGLTRVSPRRTARAGAPNREQLLAGLSRGSNRITASTPARRVRNELAGAVGVDEGVALVVLLEAALSLLSEQRLQADCRFARAVSFGRSRAPGQPGRRWRPSYRGA